MKMLLFHEFEGTGYFSQVNEHSSGRVKKPDNGLATAIYLHMYMHVLCMYFVVLYFIDLPNKQTNKNVLSNKACRKENSQKLIKFCCTIN